MRSKFRPMTLIRSVTRREVYRGAMGTCHQRPFVLPGRVREPEGARGLCSWSREVCAAAGVRGGVPQYHALEEEQFLPVLPRVIGQVRLWKGPLSLWVPFSVYFILRQNG